MDADRWEQLCAVFEAARLATGAQREAILSGAPTLREDVERLLAHHESADRLLPEQLLSRDLLESLDAENVAREVIGPYTLKAPIGEGGMGAVFLAEQHEPVAREVALKVIRPGMGTESLLSRFHAERQALARMDHPGIARIFDAGTTDDGRPYFAMEHVPGEPITSYCDALALTIPARIRLFQDVCAAVQHAHQKGVIHRDLKPSNILVREQDGKAVPKVIDFGIAKAAEAPGTDDDMLTLEGDVLGTPEYMSPEQADPAIDDVDTRADIYSLGVVLYELMTGVLPLDLEALRPQGYVAVLRAVIESNVPKPSTRASTAADTANRARMRRVSPTALAERLRGDLDWIVLKAVQRDREARYASPSELSADLDRYLNDEPVTARPPDRMDRLRKFARRNKVLLTTAGLVLGSMIAGTTVAIVNYLDARREEAHALSSRDESDLVSDFLTDLFREVDPTRAGRNARVRDLLDAAAGKMEDRFAGRPRAEARIRAALGIAYLSLGYLDDADRQVGPALTLRRTVLEPGSVETLELIQTLARLRGLQGRVDESRELHEEARALARRILPPGHRERVHSIRQLADFLRDRGEFARAHALFEEALAERRDVAAKGDRALAQIQMARVVALRAEGKREESASLLEELIADLKGSLDQDHPALLSAQAELGSRLVSEDPKRAQDILAHVVKRRTVVLGPEHPDTLLARFDWAWTHRRLGDLETAEQALEDIVAIETRKGRLNQRTPLAVRSRLAQVKFARKRLEEAKQLSDEVLAAQRTHMGPAHRDTMETLRFHEALCRALGQTQEADRTQEMRLEALRTYVDAKNPGVLRIMFRIAQDVYERGNVERAANLWQDVADRGRQALGPAHDIVVNSTISAAWSLHKNKRNEEALALLRGFHEEVAPKRGASDDLVLDVRHRIGHVLNALGDRKEGGEIFKETFEAVQDRPDSMHYGHFIRCHSDHLFDTGAFKTAIPLLALRRDYMRRTEGSKAPIRVTLSLAQAYQSLRRWSDARRELKTLTSMLVKQEPIPHEFVAATFAQRAVVERELGNLDAADEAVETFVQHTAKMEKPMPFASAWAQALRTGLAWTRAAPSGADGRQAARRAFESAIEAFEAAKGPASWILTMKRWLTEPR